MLIFAVNVLTVKCSLPLPFYTVSKSVFYDFIYTVYTGYNVRKYFLCHYDTRSPCVSRFWPYRERMHLTTADVKRVKRCYVHVDEARVPAVRALGKTTKFHETIVKVH